MNLREATALVRRQARAWEQFDPNAVAADFAENGVFISPGGRWQGQAAIRTAAQSFFAGVSKVQVTISRVLLMENQGAIEWTWTETRLADGLTYQAEDAIIFELKDDRITYWREYLDTAAFSPIVAKEN